MITSKTIANGILKAVFSIALIITVLFIIYEVRTVIFYVVVAIVLSLIANPIILFLKNKLRFKNTLAVSTTLILFFVIFLGIILLFIPLISSQSDHLSLLNTKKIELDLIEIYTKFSLYLQNHNVKIQSFTNPKEVLSKIDFSFLTNFFSSTLNFVANIGVTVATTLFISFFLLLDKIKFTDGLKQILPNQHEERILHSIDKIKSLLSRYFIGLLIQLTIVFILYLIVLLIFGIENAVIIAFLCAVLNIIPYIGPLISSILAGVLAVLSNLEADFQTVTLPTAIYVSIGFFIVQLIDNNVSSPIIFSKSVDSHPLEIFIVILIAGTLFGIAGMIVAIPMYTILKVVLKEFYPKNSIVKALTDNL
jgi:predicted PurR-regulated permease PerM